MSNKLELLEIKKELNVILDRVNDELDNISETNGKFVFTKEQLHTFLDEFYSQVVKEQILDELETCEIDADDCVELDLNGREIDVRIDEHDICQQFKKSLPDSVGYSDEAIEDLYKSAVID